MQQTHWLGLKLTVSSVRHTPSIKACMDELVQKPNLEPKGLITGIKTLGDPVN